MKKNNRPLLVIGGPNAGKTHYGGQLLGRLNHGEGQLKMLGAPVNITPFEEVLKALGQGRTAAHTAMNVYHEVILPVGTDRKSPLELVFPDYNGEEVKAMMEQRHITRDWQVRLAGSAGWLLFIRLELIRTYEDILSRPSARVGADSTAPNNDFRWTDQAYYVELLQLLLFIKGVGTLTKVKKPALTVVLSCWDELNEDRTKDVTPSELLSKIMPLFSEFIGSIWDDQHLCVIGLSALGKALQETETDEGYKDLGPENFGYIIGQDGARSADLTLPITLTMAGMS
jgi:hypothetical protein